MSEYHCPNCNGAFPQPIRWQTKWVCPWCYEEIGKHHDNFLVAIHQAKEQWEKYNE